MQQTGKAWALLPTATTVFQNKNKKGRKKIGCLKLALGSGSAGQAGFIFPIKLHLGEVAHGVSMSLAPAPGSKILSLNPRDPL